jgi:hypothetical protein
MGAEVLNQSQVGVVYDRCQRDQELGRGETGEALVEQPLHRLAVHRACEAAQRREREPREP